MNTAKKIGQSQIERVDGVVTSLSWANQMLNIPSSKRKKIKKIILEACKIFRKGQRSVEGDQLYQLLKGNEVELIGYVPNVSYIKIEGSSEQLKSFWVHPFSIPTLAFKSKKYPMVMLVNPSITFNDSILKSLEIDGKLLNDINDLKELKNMLGLAG
jgi:hypothetical protein